MKFETYNALASFNRCIDAALESLVLLEQEGIWNADYVQQQREILEQHRAGINGVVHNKLQTRERDDEEHFGKMRAATEARLKNS